MLIVKTRPQLFNLCINRIIGFLVCFLTILKSSSKVFLNDVEEILSSESLKQDKLLSITVGINTAPNLSQRSYSITKFGVPVKGPNFSQADLVKKTEGCIIKLKIKSKK